MIRLFLPRAPRLPVRVSPRPEDRAAYERRLAAALAEFPARSIVNVSARLKHLEG